MVQKGVRHLLCEAPFGPFRQKVPDPYLTMPAPCAETRSRMNAKTVISTALVWTVVGLGAVRGQTTPSSQGAPLSSGPQSAATSPPTAGGPLSPPSSLPPSGPTP